MNKSLYHMIIKSIACLQSKLLDLSGRALNAKSNAKSTQIDAKVHQP